MCNWNTRKKYNRNCYQYGGPVTPLRISQIRLLYKKSYSITHLCQSPKSQRHRCQRFFHTLISGNCTHHIVIITTGQIMAVYKHFQLSSGLAAISGVLRFHMRTTHISSLRISQKGTSHVSQSISNGHGWCFLDKERNMSPRPNADFFPLWPNAQIRHIIH